MNRPDHVACPHPCSSCPWIVANHGKPHPHGWYTKRNRDRLWAKLRTGDSMSCHRTDVSNPVPDGHQVPPEDSTVKECTGALILQQREVMNFQACGIGFGPEDTRRAYRAAHPRGLTLEGLHVIIERAMFGGVLGGLRLAKPDLNEAVGHDRLIWKGGA